jgi:predicted extracellular nuclease
MQDANGVRHWPADDRRALVAGGLQEVHAQGQYFVASRFPARCAEAQVDSGAGPLTYVRCSVESPTGTFDLITVHFESPRSGLVATRHEGIQGRDSWERNHEIRLAQSRALAGAIGIPVGPLVVAGDLNAPDSSAVLGHLRAVGLVDAFARAGRGWGYTYGHTQRPAFSFLRIDHVMASEEFDVVDAFVGGADASDHRPVVADLRLPRR